MSAIATAVEQCISFEHTCKTYASKGRSVEVLRDVSFTAQDGEFISLIGPSGCGKTTVLKLVADLIAPTSGEVRVLGTTPAEARKQRAYGIVFQEASLLPWRTVIDNIRLPFEILGTDTPQSKQRSQELIELVGLSGFADYYPDELSGGMQQRVSIARALSFNPPILLMDEPFGALDLLTRDRMAMELLKIWDQTDKTVLFITHSIAEAIFLSDRVIVFSPRPARIVEIVSIDLPRPRELAMRTSPEFNEYVRRLTDLIQ